MFHQAKFQSKIGASLPVAADGTRITRRYGFYC
jgi:hypothetical protein